MGFTAPISQGSHKCVAIFLPSYQSTPASYSRFPSSLVDSAAFGDTALWKTGLAVVISLIALQW